MKPPCVLYVSGCDGSSRCVEVHRSQLDLFCSQRGFHLELFLQTDYETDAEALDAFEKWLCFKPIVAVGHSSGCQILLQSTQLRQIPLVLLAPSLVNVDSSARGKYIFYGKKDIMVNASEYDWHPSNKVDVFENATHSMCDAMVCEKLIATLAIIADSM